MQRDVEQEGASALYSEANAAKPRSAGRGMTQAAAARDEADTRDPISEVGSLQPEEIEHDQL